MSEPWQIQLFGGLHVGPAGQRLLRLPPQLESLLAYLLINRDHQVSQQVLLDVFWTDRPELAARRSLATALWRLRRALEECADPDTPSAIHLDARARIRLDENCSLDIADFEQAVRSALGTSAGSASRETVRALEDAVALYRGDLLEHHVNEWAVRERERYQLMLEESLAYLMRYHSACGAFDRSLWYGNMALERDPLREDVHRELMSLYLRTGRRALAVRQYDICRQALAAELGIEPMGATQRLLDEVRGADEGPSADPTMSDLVTMLETAIEAQRALQIVIDELSRRTVSPWARPDRVPNARLSAS